VNRPAPANLDPFFYGILSEPLLGHERLAEAMVEKGIPFIQLRMKNAPPTALLAVARSLRRIIPAEIRFIVDDDPRVARDSGADGVHLGQQDMPLAQARGLLGPEALIGLSTHDPAQTRAACALAPDYIGVGPVFATPTKEKPDPVIGLDGMAAMLSLATVPAVVLGGIDLSNAGAVLRAGARNLSAVRCVNRAPDPGAVLDRFLGLLREAAPR